MRMLGDAAQQPQQPQQEQQCPYLPQALWALVVRHTLAAAAEAGHRAVLRQLAHLLAVSRHVAAAAREVPLQLDLRAAPSNDLRLLPPLMRATPLHCLLLAPHHAGDAEALLRCASLAATSARTLSHLAATVACTDTLQRFPALARLHLHAGVLQRLYPAVLHGLPALRHLGLHGYQEVHLAQLPPGLAATLQVLEVTPRPEAMRCQLSVQLPPGTRLRQLTVHGSFRSVLSSKAAPEVLIDTHALSRQCASVHIEAQQAVWQVPASCRGQEPEAALAAALLHPEAAWARLELQLLEGAAVELPPLPPPAPAGLGLPRRHNLDLERLVQVALQLGANAGLHARLHQQACSIFHPWLLTLERRDGRQPDLTD